MSGLEYEGSCFSRQVVPSRVRPAAIDADFSHHARSLCDARPHSVGSPRGEKAKRCIKPELVDIFVLAITAFGKAALRILIPLPEVLTKVPGLSMARFSCTSCGRCCHDLRLNLNFSEALEWIGRGGLVQVLADAAPDFEPALGQGQFRYVRSFKAVSGSLPITVNLLLVARFSGPCPNLNADMMCGIYAERPNVCRTYPADANPEREITVAQRLCPPEAWAEIGDAFIEGDTIVDQTTTKAVVGARQSGLEEVAAKRGLAADLGIDSAALANAGFAVWSPPADELATALRKWIGATPSFDETDNHWSFVSDKEDVRAMITEAGAVLQPLYENPILTYLPIG